MNARRAAALLVTVLSLAWALADGLIVIPRPPGPGPAAPFPLEVREHRVNALLEDRAAVTRIDQVFFNPTHARLEGEYLFPVPKGAVISAFSMFVDGKELQAELLDAAKARKIYEDIVRTQRDPALLEYLGQGLFKVRIFPIEPRSEKRVKLSYRQVLAEDSGLVEYVYPLNTEKFSSAPLKAVGVKVEVKSARRIRTLYCPTHEAEVVRHGENAAVVGWEASNVKPDTDFKVYCGYGEGELGMAVLPWRRSGEDGYFFLSVAPAFGSKAEETAPKDIVFVFDTSGSMAGDKMEQARKALLFCVNNLNPDDRFEVVRFSTEAEGLFNRLEKADAEHVKRAAEFVGTLKAMGGTAIEDALNLALSAEGTGDRPRMVVFLTDGKPTIGETDETRLMEKVRKANTASLRLFTFGVGFDLNTHLLDRLTDETRGWRTYIAPHEDIEIKVSAFYAKVRSPVLTDLKLSVENVRVYQVYPRELPDLFKGSTLTVFGRYSGTGEGKLVLEGKTASGRRSFEYKASFPGAADHYDFIAPLWASRRIGFLLEQIRLNGENRELVDEVTTLARAWGIITPYTSHLIVEDEARRVADRVLPADFQTLGGAATYAPEAARKMREEYDGIRSKSGAGSVRASSGVQDMTAAENLAQAAPPSPALDYRDREGKEANVARQVRNVRGRAMYQAGGFWNDATLQASRPANLKRIQFGSDAYFALLDREPGLAEFMSLGRNVRFVHQEQAYEIHE